MKDNGTCVNAVACGFMEHGTGACVLSGAFLVARDSTTGGNEHAGFEAHGANSWVLLKGCVISGDVLGCVAMEGGSLEATSCQADSAVQDGFFVPAGGSSHMSLIQRSATGCGQNGACVSGAGKLSTDKCTFQLNGEGGVVVEGEHAVAEIHDCTSLGNTVGYVLRTVER